MKASNPIEIARALIKIFNIEDDKRAEESLRTLKFQINRQNKMFEIEKQNFNVNKVINDYRAGYEEIICAILSNPCDMNLIKGLINEIIHNYKWIFEVNCNMKLNTFKNPVTY